MQSNYRQSKLQVIKNINTINNLKWILYVFIKNNLLFKVNLYVNEVKVDICFYMILNQRIKHFTL